MVYTAYKKEIQRCVAWNLVGVAGVKAVIATHAKRKVAEVEDKKWRARRWVRTEEMGHVWNTSSEEERAKTWSEWKLPAMPKIIDERTIRLSPEDIQMIQVLDMYGKQLEQRFNQRSADCANDDTED
jgi:hypothetical protein